MTIDPKSLNIKNLLPDEEVIMVMQRHWIALVYIFLYFIFLIFSIIFMALFATRIAIVWQYMNIILVIYAAVFLLFIYINWMRYELDLYIVTTKRIIGLDEVSFLNRHISECLLDKVQEVNWRTTWLLSNLLNYGEVTIHTASEASDFHMEYMPNALEAARLISNTLTIYKTKQPN